MLSITTNCNSTAKYDIAPRCAWCASHFNPRRGGSPQRFCSVRRRTAFWSALRRSAERPLVAGTVSIDALRNGRLEAFTLQGGHEASPPCSDIGSTEQPSPAPLKRFLVEISENLLRALVFRHCELQYNQQDDVAEILGALRRTGWKPMVTTGGAGERVVSFRV